MTPRGPEAVSTVVGARGAISDPFRVSLDVVELLQLHSQQLRAAA